MSPPSVIRYCDEFWRSVAADFDVVIANIGGVEYQPRQRPFLDADMQAVLSVLSRTAVANASKRFIISDNTKQHFLSKSDSGLYGRTLDCV